MASDPNSDRRYDLRMFTVDAFTNVPFSGNPAAVCLDIPFVGFRDHVLQNIATEMNLSETAFVKTLQEMDKLETANRFNLRWFTPTIEWILCGHATLATAHVLFHCLKNPSKQITFETLSGDLVVRRDGEFLAMDFPTGVTQEEKISDHENLLKCLFGGLEDIESVEFCKSIGYLVIHLQDGWTREQFEKWQPNLEGLPSYDKTGTVHLAIVTTRGRAEAGYTDSNGTPYDFASRVFEPWSGVSPEDPVTGSAHTVLAYFWSKRLGKEKFYARQCSKRGGDLWVTLNGDRTDIKGQSVLVMESRLRFK